MTRYDNIGIFVDIDGVLSDFDGHASAHGKFDEKGTPRWDALDRAWWETMPAFPGAADFFSALTALARTRFLTAPVLGTDSFAGKAEWVQKFLPDRGRFALLDLIICRSTDKALLARENHILIDDRIKNIEEWEKAGGIGIHHTGDFAQTLRRVEEAALRCTVPRPPISRPPAPR